MKIQKLGILVFCLGVVLLVVGLVALDTPLLIAGGASLAIGVAMILAARATYRRWYGRPYADVPAEAAPDPQLAELRRGRALARTPEAAPAEPTADFAADLPAEFPAEFAAEPAPVRSRRAERAVLEPAREAVAPEPPPKPPREAVVPERLSPRITSTMRRH